jgi:putative flippase GtrA
MALAQNRFFAPLWGRLRTKVGVRFTRFAGVAIASLATSEIALTLCNGVFHLSSTPAAIIAWFSGAVVSYVLSRWAWERKGKPDLLRETLPFWAVSLAVWGILGLTSHYASVWAHSMGYTHLMKHLVVQGAYFLMNCVTFVARFLFFHYVLFARRERGTPEPVPEELPTADVVVAGADTGPMSLLSGDRRPSGPAPLR